MAKYRMKQNKDGSWDVALLVTPKKGTPHVFKQQATSTKDLPAVVVSLQEARINKLGAPRQSSRPLQFVTGGE